MSTFRLSDHGYSRFFSADLVDRLRRSETLVFTADLLLDHPDPDLVYALRRAANVEAALDRRGRHHGGRSTAEIARTEVEKFFVRFARAEESLPTHDGTEDAWVSPVSVPRDHSRVWRLLKRRPTGADARRPLTEEEVAALAVPPPPRVLSGLSERELRHLARAVKSGDLSSIAKILRTDVARVPELLAALVPLGIGRVAVDPASDPPFDPDEVTV